MRIVMQKEIVSSILMQLVDLVHLPRKMHDSQS